MSTEKVLAESHTFISNGKLSRFIIFDIVHKQKRMSVRNDLFDLFYIKMFHLFILLKGFEKFYLMRKSFWPYSTGCPFST